MINTTGTIKLIEGALIKYESPKITVIGQSSALNNGDIVNVTINVTNQDASEAFTTTISILISQIETLMTTNSVDAATFVTNLYPMMEQLLMQYFSILNPDSTFELI